MSNRLIVFGLDCVGQEIFSPDILRQLPNIEKLLERGSGGVLESTIPPITVPAWVSMFTGRDPGELGLYGFRNRTSYEYDALRYSTSSNVKQPWIWELLEKRMGRSIVVGVPLTWPVRRMNGQMISGFDTGDNQQGYCYPETIDEKLKEWVGEYQFDVADFRNRDRTELAVEIRNMTRNRFKVFRNMIREEDWDLAILCEIGPDRMHHIFWSAHDPTHPRYDENHPFRNVIIDYYKLLDQEIGETLSCIGPSCNVMLASDHGAKAMHGGVCINELLINEGLLHLKRRPKTVSPLKHDDILWERTSAWAEGGFYSRVFLNLAGREPNGLVAWENRQEQLDTIKHLLEEIELPGGQTIHNLVFEPKSLYRRVRGIPPDLIVIFGNLNWRSLGTIGHDRIWQVTNDIGLDEANHAMEGMYVLSGPDISPKQAAPAKICDIAPTMAKLLDIPPPTDSPGVALL